MSRRQIRGIAAVSESCRRSSIARLSTIRQFPRPRVGHRPVSHAAVLHTIQIGTDCYPPQGDLAEQRRMKRMAKRSKAIAMYARATKYLTSSARMRSFFEHFPEAAHIRFA
jgi:hypothetical protein